jgi:hypothetical protein
MKVDLTERELAYISRAIFRQRLDRPDDEPHLIPSLDPKISIARLRAREEEKILLKNED